ncbi:MAG TPA: gliding motility protein GldC [Bacteroidetes bacterium]|nr:gliding motility protein GldC [Bacteroidota bacterium]
MNKNRIVIDIELDNKNYPEKIKWKSETAKDGSFTESKAFFLSLFDKETRDTMELDLWTKEMQVIEMDRYVFQTISSLADMYFRATKNSELANEMQKFARFFGEKTQIITK